MRNNADINDIIKNLPGKPGVYLFFNNAGDIIYIGKAKNLKKRVISYFTKKQFENNKLRSLVRKIEEIQHVIVDSESDALLLENNLVKKHQPRYNINLKDDKTFPWICIKNEPFPRVFLTRNYINDGSKYYGPYTSANTARTLLSLIRKLYPLRTCNYNLIEENIFKGKFKVCLEFHLDNCKGPCENLQSREDYDLNISNIRKILKGNIKDLISLLENTMEEYSSKYDYENALQIKEKLMTLKAFQLKSTIVSNSLSDIDVFSIMDDKNSGYVNFIKVIDGAVVQSHNVELKKALNESKQELLEFALVDLRVRLESNAKEIVLPFKIETAPEGVRISIPEKGDKKKLLDLSEQNSRLFMIEKKRQFTNQIEEKSFNRILTTLQKDLRLNELPVHIECFDNSNIQGTNPVAACVVFKNGLPVKSEYRHFNIKTVTGVDDFASMREVVFRRYTSLVEKNESLPQLIIIDGGKGQLSAAVQSLEKQELRGKIAIIGIAKRLEEIYFPDDPVPLYLDKNSESLKLIQKVRNEAHRFGINFHKLKRSGNMTASELDIIKGVGEKTMHKLIQSIGSLDNVKAANIQELIEVVGKSRALLIYEYFHKE